MESWKVIVLLAVGVILVWALAPSRHFQAKQSDVVEITYLGPGGPIAGSMADVVMAFEQESLRKHQEDPSKPIYKVISGQSGNRDPNGDPTRFLISIAGGEPPDVIFFGRFALSEWAARGAFTPLNQFIERDLAAGIPDAVSPERYYQAAWEEASYQGEVYAIPTDIDDRALIYSKDLFRRAGLVDYSGEPTPPKTWAQLREYAQKLTQRDEKGNIKVLGFAPNYGNAWLYIYGWLNGAQFMSQDGLTCLLNEERVVEALQFMVDIYDDAGGYEAVSAFQTGFQGGALDPLLTGKIGMKIDGNWQMNFFAHYGRDFDFGVAGAPTSDRYRAESGEETISWSGGWSHAIPVNAVHKEAAWEFIRFISTNKAWEIRMESDRQSTEAQGRPYIPIQAPIKDLNELFLQRYILDNPKIPVRIKEGCAVFQELLPVSRYRPNTPVGQLLWNWHVTATEEACYGKKTPKDSLDYAARVVQRELDQIINPVQGRVVNWSGFFAIYAFLIVAMATAVYLWDTRIGWRRRFMKVLYPRRSIGAGDVIEGSRGGYFRAQWWAGYIFCSPWLLGFIVFGGGPLLFSVLMSFCDYDIINKAQWIGLENYRWMLFHDELVPIAVRNTLYMALGIPLGMIASLAIALLLNLRIRGISFWRTIFYLPAIVPAVASFILWIWIFNPSGGVINQALRTIHIEGPNWLGSETWSKPSLIVMGLWTAGGGMLIWLAGLKGIPEHYYEAASIDGATEWQQFLHITLPMLTPYIFFNLVMGLIGVLQIFDAAFVMTGGGPVNSTLFYVYHLFNNAFRYGHMGYACAMAWMLFVVVLVLTVVQLKLAKRWVHYESD